MTESIGTRRLVDREYWASNPPAAAIRQHSRATLLLLVVGHRDEVWRSESFGEWAIKVASQTWVGIRSSGTAYNVESWIREGEI